MRNLRNWAIMAMMVLVALPTMAAEIDYWTKATVIPVLKGGQSCAAAAKCYVSASKMTDAAAIAAVAEEGGFAADAYKLTGESGTSAVNKEWYFYVLPHEGYVFLGFATSSTGTPSDKMVADKLDKVDDYYMYAGTAGAGWSANTEVTAKELKRYAVFERKQADPVAIDVTGLPTYETAEPTPADGSKVTAFRTLTIHLYSETYDDAVMLMPVPPSVVLTKKDGESTVLDNKVIPTVKQRADDSGSDLILTIDPAIADTCTIEVSIPMGITNNLGAIAGKTKDQLMAMGYCTNPEMKLTYELEPAFVAPVRITNQTDTVLLPDAELKLNSEGLDLGNGNEVMAFFVKYPNKLISCIPSADFKFYVSVVNESNGEVLGLNQYNCEIGVPKLSPDQKKNYRDSCYLCIRLSSENYINHQNIQGRYHVVIRPGIAIDELGLRTGGAEFYFNYGDPEQSQKFVPVDMTEYVGTYRQHMEATEVLPEGQREETFALIQDEEDAEKFYITNVLKTGTVVRMLIYVDEHKYRVAEATEGLYSFVSPIEGTDVEIRFEKQMGGLYIYMNPYVMIAPHFNVKNMEGYYGGGACYYDRISATPDLEGDPEPEITSMEDVTMRVPAEKVLRNGHLVIVKEGIEYNACGVRM